MSILKKIAIFNLIWLVGCAATPEKVSQANDTLDAKEHECGWSVGRSCLMPPSEGSGAILIEIASKNGYPFHDSDDVSLFDVRRNEFLVGGMSGSVQIDENDQILSFSPTRECNRIVYYYFLKGSQSPEVVDIEYFERMGLEIELEQGCDIFPKHVVTELGL